MVSSASQGRLAEDEALSLLQARGLRLIDRNYRSRFGEIDLIMKDGHTLVFVEVRYRRSIRYGTPQESVTQRKQSRLLVTAACYLKEKRIDCPVRFDVAALSPAGDGMSLNWIKSAFDAG